MGYRTVTGLPGNAGIPGVPSVSEVPFELADAGSPAVIDFPAVDSIVVVASIPARVSSKQTKKNSVLTGTNRNKICFGLFRETKNKKIWVVSVF
jgi:hypothetical protein